MLLSRVIVMSNYGGAASLVADKIRELIAARQE